MLHNLLIVDDHLMFGGAMQYLLKQYDPQLCSEAVGSGKEALEYVRSEKPIDLILLDYALPDLDGIEVLKQILLIRPNQRVGMISGTEDVRLTRQAMEAGSLGWIPKHLSEKPLLDALRLMASGEAFLPYELVGEMLSRQENARVFTPTELDVAEHLIEGLSDKQIAQELGCEVRTIQVHVRRLYQKTKTSNRVTFTNKFRSSY